MAETKLIVSEVARRLGESARLVRLWCKQGRFPNAKLQEDARGPYYVIPESDLQGFVKPKPGPIPRPKVETPAKTRIETPAKTRKGKR